MITTINEFKENMLPCGHAIGDEVTFVPMYRQQQKYGIACEQQYGTIIAVRFTKAKILYDIVDDYYGILFDNVDSCKVYSSDTHIDIVEEDPIEETPKEMAANVLADYDNASEELTEKRKNKLSDDAKEFIANKIKLLVDEGRPQDQAVAMAYSYAKKDGLIKENKFNTINEDILHSINNVPEKGDIVSEVIINDLQDRCNILFEGNKQVVLVGDFRNKNSVNEKVDIKSKVINIKLLTTYAEAIEKICNYEYGYTYFNPETNYIAVCLGDSSPFNDDTLTDWFKNTLIEDYKNIDNVKIEIDCEWQPEAPYIFKNGKWNKN